MKHLIYISIFLFLISCKEDEKVEQKNWEHVNSRINNPRYESEFSVDVSNYDGVFYIKANNSNLESGLEEKSIELESYFKNGNRYKSVSNFAFQDEAISSSDGGGFTYYWKYKKNTNLDQLNQLKITFNDEGKGYSFEIPFQNQYENITVPNQPLVDELTISLNYFTDNIYFLNLESVFDEFYSMYSSDLYYTRISSRIFKINKQFILNELSKKGTAHRENSSYVFNLFSYKTQELNQNDKKFLLVIESSIYFAITE